VKEEGKEKKEKEKLTTPSASQSDDE